MTEYKPVPFETEISENSNREFLMNGKHRLSLARGTNRQFYCTGVIIYNKTRQLFFVSVVRQTFLGFEMTSNFRDTSPLMIDE